MEVFAAFTFLRSPPMLANYRVTSLVGKVRANLKVNDFKWLLKWERRIIITVNPPSISEVTFQITSAISEISNIDIPPKHFKTLLK